MIPPRRPAATPARAASSGQPATALRTRTSLWLRDVLLPLRAGVPLDAAARRRVALVWAALGAGIAALWSLALVIAFARPPLGAALLVVALTAGAAMFFGALGYLLVGLGNRMVARDRAPRPSDHD